MRRHHAFLCGLLVLGSAAGLAGGDPPVPDYLPRIATDAEFALLSVASQVPEIERTTKYLIPARDDPALLQSVFQNANRYPLHVEFLRTVFPDRFPGLDVAGYLALVEQRATRTYFAGTLSRIHADDTVFYGFSVFTRDATIHPEELLDVAEVRAIWQKLDLALDIGPLHYAPRTAAEIDAAREWRDPGFPMYLGAARGTYEAYTRAVGYGTVRRLTAEEFEEAASRGRLAWQDILVLERAPSDIEGVVAGVITGEPQDELTHVAVRTARRGTPNAYLEDALEKLEPVDGKLVRLEVGATEYSVREATLAEAEAWWEEHRPRLSKEPTLDLEHATLDGVDEMELDGATSPVARFGGKASNFARLQRVLAGEFEEYRDAAFAIPVRYYVEFLRQNRTKSAVDPSRNVTYEEYLRELLEWEPFATDPEFRHAALARFRDEVEDHGTVDPILVMTVLRRIREVFGSDDVALRFRSSSNVEDSLEFNGAGLYDSTSGCGADDLDSDVVGPSLCDPDEPEEQSVARAMKKVWASLWTFRANEERSYFGIDAEKVAMGILVSRAFLREAANGVAFTGNPATSLDRRYMVLAQVGEGSVVSPDPGVSAEKDLLEMEGGTVRAIERARRSSLSPPGEYVLSEDTLRELGKLLGHLDGTFPVDLAGHEPEDVLLDVEYKVDDTGSVDIKQIRPFLLSEPPAPGPTFELVIPADTTVCGVFTDGRSPRGEYEAKSQLRLRAGTYQLPTAAPVFEASLVEWLVYGVDKQDAAPVVPGRFRWSRQTQGTLTTYDFAYRETRSLPGGEEVVVELSLRFNVVAGEEPRLRRTLDEEYLTESLILSAIPGDDRDRIARFASCGYERIPRWQVRAELENGDLFDLEERSIPPEAESGSRPANLVGASIRMGGETREVRDYWRLVYSAQHHNEDVVYWIVLDPPVFSAVAGGLVRAVELAEPDLGTLPRPARARYLGETFQTLAEPEVACWGKGALGTVTGCRFRRGDVDGSGGVNITDAIFQILHLYHGGQEPTCPDAADFDDDGVAELTDIVLVLSYLFRGADLSAPPGPRECGVDPTMDSLGPCSDPGCP